MPPQHAPRNAMEDPEEIAFFHDDRRSASGRREPWTDAGPARALRAARRG